MRPCIVATLVLLAALPHTAPCQEVIDRLDEIDGWIAVGDGAAVTRVMAEEAPEGVDGNGAIRCDINTPGRTQLHLRCPVAEHDLTRFGQLRFRMHGGLSESLVALVTVIDSSWRHRQWLSPALGLRGREARWTEFQMALDSPSRDLGADMHDIQWITWFIIVPADVTETGSLYIDGLRFEPRGAAVRGAPGPEQVVLESSGVQAIFSKNDRFELTRMVLPDGETIPVQTRCEPGPLEVIGDTRDTVRIGAELAWNRVEVVDGALQLDYVVGEYRLQTTFSWQEGALSVHRVATAQRHGVTTSVSHPQSVVFPEQASELICEHGSAQSRLPVPPPEAMALPGTWVAARDRNGVGVAAIVPKVTSQRADVAGMVVSVVDRLTVQGCDVPEGARSEYCLWLRPLAAGTSITDIEATTRAICARLAAEKSQFQSYFAPRHQPFERDGTTLADTDACTVWQASVSRAIDRDEEPPAARSDGVMLWAARGEVEPVHLSVFTKRPMGEISVSCSGLRSPEATIDASHWRARYPTYIDLRRTTQQEQQAADKAEWARYIGVVDDPRGELVSDRFHGQSARVIGRVEDPLLNQAPPALQAGHNQPIWLTLNVPADARPGEYAGEVAIAEARQEICRIPVSLRVWSFALPRVTSLRTWYQLWRTPIPDTDWNAYYRDLAEHKVSGFGGMPVEPPLRLTEDGVAVDWAEFDRAGEYLFDELGMRNAKLPHGKRGGNHRNVYQFLGLDLGTPEFEAAYGDYLRQAREHLAERGWLDGFDCYIFDEPDQERIETIRTAAPMIRNAIPKMRVFAACAHNTLTLTDALNAWCPPLTHFGAPVGDFTPQRIAQGRARGDVYWWYNQDDNCIGAPIVTHRALPWASWQADLAGYFVWAISYWGSAEAMWVTPYEIGEAMAIYPGKSGPIDSLRWEQTREGLEDYDYLVLLQKAVEDGALTGADMDRARTLLERARTLFPDPRCQLATDPAELLALRWEIGSLLDAVGER